MAVDIDRGRHSCRLTATTRAASIALVGVLIIPMFASVADARGRDKADFHYEGTTKCWSNNTRCK